MIYPFKVILHALVLAYRNCSLTFKLKSYFAFLQKLLSLDVFCKDEFSWRFRRFCRTKPVFQSFYNEIMGLRVFGFIDEHLPMTASNSLNFDILLDSFLYSVSFVICFYSKFCHQLNLL